VHLPALFFAPEEKNGDWSNRTTRLVVAVLSDLALAGRAAAAAVNLAVAARSVMHVLSVADPEIVPENSLVWSAILVSCPCSAGTHPELLQPDSLASGPVSFFRGIGGMNDRELLCRAHPRLELLVRWDAVTGCYRRLSLV
jgi:hypothetical protein